MLAQSPVYHPREPTDSPLWKVLRKHYEAFKAGYDEHCEKQYGFFRPVVDEVVEEYLRCGDLHEACPELVEGAGLLRPGNESATSELNSEASVLDVSEHQPRRVASKTWRELIRKIWEVDPLSCPRCAHEMKIISLINDPKRIERILRHPGLWRQHPDPDQERTKAPVDGPVVLDGYDDGWPGYEEPVIVHP